MCNIVDVRMCECVAFSFSLSLFPSLFLSLFPSSCMFVCERESLLGVVFGSPCGSCGYVLRCPA